MPMRGPSPFNAVGGDVHVDSPGCIRVDTCTGTGRGKAMIAAPDAARREEAAPRGGSGDFERPEDLAGATSVERGDRISRSP